MVWIAPPAWAQPADPGARDHIAIEEIVVTARKRQESLQDGDELRDRQITRLDDVRGHRRPIGLIIHTLRPALRQLLQQRLRVLQVLRVRAFAEPFVDRGQE